MHTGCTHDSDSLTAVVSVTMILLGLLLGLLAGMTVCARYIRQELAAKISPRLGHIESQLTNVQREVANVQREVALSTEIRLVALSGRIDQRRPDN